MNVEREVLHILQSALGLEASGAALNSESALLGSVAELDSMAVVSVLTTLEERFGFAIDDDEIDGRTFASVRTLVDFVEAKLRQ